MERVVTQVLINARFTRISNFLSFRLTIIIFITKCYLNNLLFKNSFHLVRYKRLIRLDLILCNVQFVRHKTIITKAKLIRESRTATSSTTYQFTFFPFLKRKRKRRSFSNLQIKTFQNQIKILDTRIPRISLISIYYKTNLRKKSCRRNFLLHRQIA